jgi:hypothetical protein
MSASARMTRKYANMEEHKDSRGHLRAIEVVEVKVADLERELIRALLRRHQNMIDVRRLVDDVAHSSPAAGLGLVEDEGSELAALITLRQALGTLMMLNTKYVANIERRAS